MLLISKLNLRKLHIIVETLKKISSANGCFDCDIWKVKIAAKFDICSCDAIEEYRFEAD
jgi:hypothetical protein